MTIVWFRYLFLIISTSTALGQESASSEVKGKINGDTFNLYGVYVINLTTKKAVLADTEGYFVLHGVAGDTLSFSGVQYISRRIVLTSQDFEKGFFFVKMESIMNQLDEVVIRRYDNINAVSLGVISANQKSYTPAERKLRTAGDFKPIMLLGLIGGSMALDPLINKINGRTKRLKKEVILEKKELNIKYLGVLFEEGYFVKYLKIPSEYVEGFKYYAVENEKFTIILESKNKVTTEFLLGELAIKYKEIIACENK
jgi:hypothetical protein